MVGGARKPLHSEPRPEGPAGAAGGQQEACGTCPRFLLAKPMGGSENIREIRTPPTRQQAWVRAKTSGPRTERQRAADSVLMV